MVPVAQVEEAAAVVVIENWSVVSYAEDPEPRPIYFHGRFIGYPGKPEEHEATSSRVLGYKEADQTFVCHSRCYRLGSMDPKWAERYPEVSLEKLLENMPRITD